MIHALPRRRAGAGVLFLEVCCAPWLRFFLLFDIGGLLGTVDGVFQRQ
jgi:hypothetical protein